MAAAKGKKGRTPNIHLLQEPQAGACGPPSTSGFVGGLGDWVGSFNSTSPFHTHTQTHTQKHSNIILAFYYISAQVACNCLEINPHVTTAEGQ